MTTILDLIHGLANHEEQLLAITL